MIAVDTNILVYAHREECEFHDAAAACVTSLAEGAQPWGIPVQCQQIPEPGCLAEGAQS